ncbi:MAG: hypothetical protein HYS17_03475 [Micavibrio aeruginosavorus]|uniref:Uncharacterized protein n=1 Tax=Micavibrio aeruginosavorus TaxID=349221 RepID=A0A7T5R3F3_9BACT|nr:MAG: hypothetical protein HYS17_03475 [Micavibrio aeruginosavorus]
MTEKTPAPHRRIQVEIHIGADSWKDLKSMVGDIAREIRGAESADENLYWVSNGEGAGADLSLTVDHAMTREQYKRDLQAWNPSQKRSISHDERP